MLQPLQVPHGTAEEEAENHVYGVGESHASLLLEGNKVYHHVGLEVADCDADVLVQKGEKRVGGRSSNKKGTDDVISNGSIINVNDGQCMIIVESGKVVDFDAEKEKEIIADINDKKPNVLFVCLGAPKQEKWIYDNREKLNVSLALGLGGSLDVFAGTAQRAPEIWCKLGLEWLYRLIKEPWRFWRMMALPKFGFTVLFKGKRYKKIRVKRLKFPL